MAQGAVPLKQAHELVLFTTNVGLEDWRRLGHLERELRIYAEWARRFGRVTFLTYGNVAKEKALEKAIAPIRVWPVPKQATGLLADVAAIVRGGGAFRRCTLVKTNQVRAGLVGAVAKWLWRKPLIVRCGFVPSEPHRDEQAPRPWAVRVFHRWIEAIAFRAADAIIVTSEDGKEHICRAYRLDPRKVTVIGNAIDVDLFRPMPEVPAEPGTVCFVGRFSVEKNLDNLLRAMQGTGLALLAYGSGPLKGDLVRLADELGVSVEWCGRVPNQQVPEALNRGQVSVLCSLYEGNPKVLLEAMACGACVVATAVPGIRNVVQDGVTGILCHGTGPEAIREGLLRATRDPALAARVGNAARDEVCRRYVLDRLLEQEAAVLTRVLGRRAR